MGDRIAVRLRGVVGVEANRGGDVSRANSHPQRQHYRPISDTVADGGGRMAAVSATKAIHGIHIAGGITG